MTMVDVSPSSQTSPNLPPMGMRVRLKASFSTAGLSPHAKVIAEALKPAFDADKAKSLSARVAALAAKHPLYPGLTK